ncbi:MAG: hypothetical protein ACYC5O_00735 [Anaerolineae bacterium]
MRTWVKLYTEDLDDPAIGRLSDRQHRLYTNLNMLAGVVDDGGRLGALGDIAYRVRRDEAGVAEDLAALAAAGFVGEREGTWWLLTFAERQAKPVSDSREAVRQRVAAHRASRRNDGVTALPQQQAAEVTPLHPPCNEDVTTGVTECNAPRVEKSREEEKREEESREGIQASPGATSAPSGFQAWLSHLPSPPVSFEDWCGLLQHPPKGDNMVGVLMRLHQALFEGRDLPEPGHFAALAKQLHGRQLAAEMWELASRPPNGDVLAFIQGKHKRGRDSPRGNRRDRPPEAMPKHGVADFPDGFNVAR